MSSTSTISSNPPLQTLYSQPKQDFLSLQQDLGSGNMAAAQKDFAAFQQDALNLLNTNANNAPTPASKLNTDLQALQTALNSGDVKGAQSAFASFQQDLQNAGGAHRHHGHGHHHHSQDSDSQTNGTGTTNSSQDVNGINSAALMASMMNAYQTFASAGLSVPASTLGITA